MKYKQTHQAIYEFPHNVQRGKVASGFDGRDLKNRKKNVFRDEMKIFPTEIMNE